MSKKRVFYSVLLSLILFVGTICPSSIEAASIKDSVFSVQFNSNGGSYVAPIYNVTYGESIELPASPSRYNYWFRGWYTNISLTTKFTETTPIYQNTVLYAKWEQKSSTPNILSQTITSGSISTSVTVDITGQNYGSACEMALVSYVASDLKNVVYTQNKTSKYIGFELNINDLVFDKTTPLPVSIKVPASFNAACVQVLYTTDMETVAGIPSGYLNSSGEYVFDAYYSGTYVLMEAQDEATTAVTSNTKLSITVPTALKAGNQYVATSKITGYLGSDSNYELKWYSSKPYVAHITKDGIITPKVNGKTYISCVSTDGTLVAKKLLTVYKKRITSMSLNTTTKKLKKGKTFQIKVSVKPSTAYSGAVAYTSSNTKIATVTSSGKVKAIKKGTCYITVKSIDGSKKTKKLKVTVTT